MRIEKKIQALFLVLILMSFLFVPSLASKNEAAQKTQLLDRLVSVKPLLPKGEVSPGQTLELALEITIAPGYHINSERPEDEFLVPTSIELKKDSAYEIKEIIFPKPEPKKFNFSDKPLSVYEGQFKIKIKIELAEDICGDSLELEGKFHYQACDQQACLKPEAVPFKLKIPIS
ncbi:MAG: protein-disulfide reductase DsbD N-terminal domain-containing protein [Candidatus Saccharicenans sp.]